MGVHTAAQKGVECDSSSPEDPHCGGKSQGSVGHCLGWRRSGQCLPCKHERLLRQGGGQDHSTSPVPAEVRWLPAGPTMGVPQLPPALQHHQADNPPSHQALWSSLVSGIYPMAFILVTLMLVRSNNSLGSSSRSGFPRQQVDPQDPLGPLHAPLCLTCLSSQCSWLVHGTPAPP